MPDVAELVAELGGVAHKQQLVARGVKDVDLTRAVRDESVTRPRQGWYSTLDRQNPVLLATRVGGRLTGISAVTSMGGWAFGDHPLHVSVPSNSSRHRSQWNRRRPLGGKHSVRLHWDSPEVSERGSSTHVALRDALVRIVLDEPLETAVAALDWALHTGVLDPLDFDALITELPKRLQPIRELVDAACESLPESLGRTRLRLAGHHVVSQVTLGRQRIDLVVDGIVGFEVDGEAHHLDRFVIDRRKDLAMTLARFHAIRAPATMVFHEWETVLAAIEAALAQHHSLSGIQETTSRLRGGG